MEYYATEVFLKGVKLIGGMIDQGQEDTPLLPLSIQHLFIAISSRYNL